MYYIIGAAVVIVIFIVGAFMKFQWDLKKLDVQYVHDFIEKNKDNSSFSMYVVHNGRALMDINRHAMIPLASTVKIIIAIEYAHQAAEGRIDPSERVTVDALDRYYFKNLDGGAHESWLKTVDAEAITFEQVAKG